MKKRRMNIGWAQGSITPDVPVLMEGQMYQRYSRYIHDPLTATVLVLDNGTVQAILVSMDMTEVPLHAMEPIRTALKAYPEIPYDAISFNVTHSHNSTSFYNDFMRVENEMVYNKEILPNTKFPSNMLFGEEGQRFFSERISALIVEAWEKRKPGGVSCAHEYAAVAFSRRPQFVCEDGIKSVMYGDCSEDNFVRFEGGTDASAEFLYTWDEEGQVTGVVCNIPCPSQVYELHSFISADYWAPSRNAIREKLGRNVYVLPVCGAAGDLAPVDLVHISKCNKEALREWGGQTKEVFRNFDMTLLCQNIGERISEAALRGYRLAKNYIDYAPEFCHRVMSMSLPIRRVTEDEYLDARKQVEEINKAFSREQPMTMDDLVKAFEPQGVVLRYQQQNHSGEYEFICHLLRIGNVAIATNPFELYHEFAQRIKARAKAEQVIIIQLSNGAGGYLPTRSAVNGGSYSSRPASTVCGPEGGDILVEETLKALDEFWMS